MSDEKQVTIKKEAELPSTILFEDDSAAGFENVKTTSLALPILKLLQNGSGEAQRRNQNYVDGAEPGMLLNTVTKQLYDGAKGVSVIPCHYKLEYQEWADLERVLVDQKISFQMALIFYLKQLKMVEVKID